MVGCLAVHCAAPLSQTLLREVDHMVFVDGQLVAIEVERLGWREGKLWLAANLGLRPLAETHIVPACQLHVHLDSLAVELVFN